MIDATVTTVDESQAVLAAVQKADYKNLGHAAASIRKEAIASIISNTPRFLSSAPGNPPHSRRGLYRRAILYAVDPLQESAVIGPAASVAGISGVAHEFGGWYGSGKQRHEYPARPFMGPALDKNLDRFAQEWAGSVST